MGEALASLSIDENSENRKSSSQRAGACFEGDIVQVLNDSARVKLLQQGHGEWTDAMNEVLVECNLIVSSLLPTSFLLLNPLSAKPLSEKLVLRLCKF